MISERWRRGGCDGLEGRDITGFSLFKAVKDDIAFVDELRKLSCIPALVSQSTSVKDETDPHAKH